MISKIVNVYIRILNILYKNTSRLNNKLRNIILSFCCFYCMYWYYCHHTINDPLFIEISHAAILLCLVLGLIVIVSNDRPIQIKQINKPLVILYLLVLLGMYTRFIIGGISGEEKLYYFLHTLCLTFIFPCIYIIWNNRKDYDVLLDRVAISYAVIDVVYFINMFFLASNGNMLTADNGGVKASIVNPNLLGSMAICGTVSSLYLIYRFKDKIYVIIFGLLCFASGMTMTIMSICRTAFVCVMIATFVFVIYVLKDKNNFKRNSIFVSIIIVLSLLLCLMFNYVGKIYIRIQNSNYVETTKEVISIETNTASSNIETSNKVGVNDIKELTAFEKIINKFNKSKDLNRLTSGRLKYWSKYFRHVKFFGNDKEDLIEEFGSVYVPDAHNVIVDMIYLFGIPTGIVYILFILYLGIYALKVLFNKKYSEPHNLFVVLTISMFAFYLMFNSATNIFILQPQLLFYFVILPCFDKDILFNKNK